MYSGLPGLWIELLRRMSVDLFAVQRVDLQQLRQHLFRL
jgi:hypothetical protein